MIFPVLEIVGTNMLILAINSLKSPDAIEIAWVLQPDTQRDCLHLHSVFGWLGKIPTVFVSQFSFLQNGVKKYYQML